MSSPVGHSGRARAPLRRVTLAGVANLDRARPRPGDSVTRGAVPATRSDQIGARQLTASLRLAGCAGPAYRSLADQIRLLIIDGRIPVGARLPAERDLSAALDRSRSTVVAAYAVLRDAGYLRSRRGSGSVAAMPASPPRARPIDFAHAVPPPIPGLADYLRRALGDVDRVLDAPGFDVVGDEVLRDRLAQRYTARGLPTTAADLVITVGAQHALASVARVLVRPGDRVLMDSPCYPHAYDAFQAAGGRVVTTPVSWSGWDVEHMLGVLDRYCPTAAYLMPDFQNPTGASMTPADRKIVAAAAARSGTTLVVDETTADLDISRGWVVPPFAHLARRQGTDVVTVGSLSKSLWGGLRMGWVRAGPAFVDRIVRARPASDLGTPRLEQVVAAALIPDLDRLLPMRSATLRTHRDYLIAALGAALPDWQVPTTQGGLSLWVRLEHPVGSSLAVAAHAEGLLVSAGPRFTLDGSHQRFLRLPFTEPTADLSRGVDILQAVWSSLAGRRWVPALRSGHDCMTPATQRKLPSRGARPRCDTSQLDLR